ncbi:NUDIX domain-containing protein [Povalibacter sp.]|uniref:NUDIX domain-containing protein n=1 Tax=Povalibacter sp. TaxID=1962978 RepID=UPI002F3E30FF
MTFVYCPICAAPLMDSVVDREARRVCSRSCGFVHYDNPTPVVAAVVEHEGAIVLAHNRAWPGSFYGLITGFLEQRESPSACAVREVKEELNLDAVGEPTLIGVYPFERMNQVIIGYHVLATGTIALNEELDAYKHVAFEDCRVWPAGTGFALRDWLRGRGYEPEMIRMERS